MTISILILKEDIKKLQHFLKTGELEEIYWTEKTFFPIPDYLLVNLSLTDYDKLVEVSSKLENIDEISESVIQEDTVEDFKNIDFETLKIFNHRGLYSKLQLQDAFNVGMEHLENIILKKSDQPFINNTDFDTWFNKI